MDPHGRDEFNEDLIENIIRGGEDDVTSLFLNNSGEGDEELNRRDGSGEGEVDRSGEGEVDRSGEGEVVRSGEGRSGDGTIITTNTGGEVTEPLLLATPVMKHVLSIYLYINVLFFPLALWIEIEQIFCKDEKRPS